jgi:hypothetical protein
VKRARGVLGFEVAEARIERAVHRAVLIGGSVILRPRVATSLSSHPSWSARGTPVRITMGSPIVKARLAVVRAGPAA